MADLSLFGSAEFQEETPLEAVSPNMPMQFDPEADIKDIVPAVQGNLDQLGSNDVSTLSADVAPNPLINSRELTHGMDPVRTSKVLTLSRESGLPPRVVEQHVDEMERRRTISDEKLDLIQNQYPQTAQLLSDPDFFAVAQDDIDRLTALEGTIRQYNPGVWERIGTKWEESRQQLEDGVRGFALGALSSYVQLADEEEAGGFVPNAGVKALRELARGALAHVQAKHDAEKAKRTAPLLPAENNLQQYVEDFVGASAPILATMGISAFGSPYAGAAFMGTQIAGGDYLSRKEQGASDVAAFGSGLADAALQAPLEALSLGKFFNIFKATGGAQILKTVATALGTEFTTEFLQKFPEDLTEDLALMDVRGQDVWDALGGFMDNLDETAKAGLYEGLLSAPWALLGGAGQVVRDYSNLRATEQEQAILDSLTQDIAQTNLAQLDPVLHQQALQILASGSQIENVFIDSQAFEVAYGQDVASQTQVLDSLGISQEAYQNAVATGEELTVQLGNYASTVAAFPEFANNLANDRKLSKQGLTRNEWMQTQQELAKTYQDILIQSQEEVQAATQEDAETKAIYEQVYAARQAAGRVPDAARLDAAQFTAALVSMAKMSEGKYTPAQLFEAYMPQVRAGQTVSTVSTPYDLDAELDRIRGEIQSTGIVSDRSPIDWAADAITSTGWSFDQVLDGVKTALQEGRFDLVRAAIARAKRIAANRSITPTVTEENPKYKGIKEDLERWKVLAEEQAAQLENLAKLNGYTEPGAGQTGVDQQADTTPLMQDTVASIGININDSAQPFTEQILTGEKTIETRNSDSLRPYVGRRVGIVRTGLGQAQLVGYATIGEPKVYTSEEEFRADEAAHRVAAGSAFDFKGQKYGYPMLDVERVDPRPLASRGIIARSLQQDAAYAGVENEAEVEEAGRLWAEMGTESPYFKRWFGESKVVDESGKPLVVYHGTRDDIDEFKDIPEKKNDAGWLGRGFYFSNKPDLANFYARQKYGPAGENVIPAYLSLRNPYRATMEEKKALKDADRAGRGEEAANAFRDKLIAEGYDGVILDFGMADGTQEIVAFDPTQIKSATGNRGTFDPADARILYQRADAPAEQAEDRKWAKHEPERTKAGKIKGAPEWVQDDKDLAKMRREMRKFVQEGLVGRFWYENSAQAVVDMVGGDVALAEKFIQLLAIYSPNSNVWVNSIQAVRAYTHWARGGSRDTFSVGSGDGDGKAISVLYDDVPWNGRKTNSFYLNLMYDIAQRYPDELARLNVDEEVITAITQPATIDVWMARAFGYAVEQFGNDKGSGQYSFAENEVRRLTARLNREREAGSPRWTPHQVQAAVWTAIKTRYEIQEVKDATNKRSQKQGLIYKALNDKGKEAWVYPKNAELRRKHLANWRHFAMQVKTEQVIAEAEINARSFGDDLQRMTNVVTWEANPSTAFGYDINNASPEVLRNFTAEARALLMDEDGNDTLAMMLGVPLTYSANGFGAYASAVSPNNLAHLLPSRAKGQEGFSAEEVRAYARAIQYIFKQDAVPWFRPENKALTSEAAQKDQQFKVINTATGRLVPKGRFDTQAEAEEFAKTKGEGFEVRGGNLAKAVVLRYDRALESADLERILGVIKDYLGEDAGFTRTADNEITLINFRDDQTKLPWVYDEAFIKAVDSFADDHGADLGLIENKSIWTEGEYGYVQDWSQDKDGRALLSEGSLSGRPDLHPWLRSRRDAFEVLIERYSGDNLAREQEGVTLFQLAPVRGGGPQILRAGDVGRVRANYGEQAPGGRSVVGIHYSSEPRESLSGHFYGSGIKGAEAKRLDLSDDPRLKKRIHFYVDRGQGIRPEPGVGANIHAVNLNNLYDISEDPLGLKAAAYADKMIDPAVAFNNLESAIIDAGFDGILVPNAQTNNGVAVLLGDKHANVPVDLVQPPRGGQAAQAATAVPSVSARVIQEPDGSQRIMYTDNDTARIAGSATVRDGVIRSTEIRPAFEGKGFEQAIAQDLQGRGVDTGALFQNQGQSMTLNQAAYHGSPYRFSKFSLDHMGSGEGAQAYGYGLYFSSIRDIAEFYRQNLTNSSRGGLGLAGVVPPSPQEGLSDTAWTSAKNLSQLLVSDAGVVKSFGEMDVVGQQRVLSVVRGLLQDDKILNTVVRFIPVDVVNMLAGKEYAADYLFNNPSVLIYLLPRHADDFVSSSVEAMNVLAPAVALAAAKVHTGLGRFDVLPSDFFSAEGALHDGTSDVISSKIPKPNEFVKGQLYKVEIPEDDVMLHWDRPLSEQPEKVRDGIENIRKYIAADWLEDTLDSLNADFEELTGAELYRVLGKALQDDAIPLNPGEDVERALEEGDGKKAASLLLNSEEIKGIKYLDGTSRVQGEGSYNYVIFDDSTIDILETFYQNQSEPQASFTFRTKSGRPLIELFRTANQSSFLHETGHLYLEMMRELALAPNAPAPVTALWAQAKAALKIDDGPITREAHEEWARNLEAYFLEGAAPSLGLRKIFAQYAQWLRSIYKQVEQIFLQSGTQFNEDLKPIFDRIFATEKDIEEARNFYASQKPFFAAMDPKVMAKEREKYEERRMRARESMEDKRLRQLTEAWVKASGGKAKIRAEVTEEVKARPVMAVIKGAAGGMNMAALDSSVGDDLRKQLKAIGRYSSLVKKEGTVDPDILAAENGYDSVVAMVEDLLAFPGEKAAITAGVEARMEAERQRIARGLAETDLAADEAYHNDDQLAVLVAEFEILSQQAAQKVKRLEAAMVRDVAKQLLASEKVNFATQSSRFARLERRAAKLARAAYERGDAKKAAEYKRQEVLSHAMFIESVALKEGVAKTAARIKRGIQKTKGISPEVKTLLQGLGIQYGILPYKKERDPVRAFEMWNQDLVAKGGKIPTIEGWVDEMRKLGISAPLDPFLNNAAAVGYKDITVGQFRALEEGVRILRRVDRGLHTVTWIDGSTITMEDAIERLQAHVAGRGGKAPDPLTYDPNAVTLAARNFFAEHTKTSTIIQALDNWEAGGLFYQLIYRPVMDADSDLSARWATEAPKIKALFEPIRRQLRKKVVVLGKARPRAQLVAAALNVGNQGNRERLIAGLGINEAQLDQLLAPLTTEEMDFVQAVWDYIATFKDEAFAVERRLTGREPAAVDPVPFEFKGKTYAGGYYPVSYDKNLRDQKGEARDAKEALDELFGGTPAGTAMTAHGHLEARASAGTGERLSQELSVISDHVAQVLRDITHREAVVNVAKLLKNKQIMALITDVVGREKAKQLWPWLVSVSKEGREQIQLTAVEKMLLHFRPAMTFYTQAYKVGTALMQAAGFLQVFEFVQAKHVGQAVWQLYGKGLLSLNMFSDGEIISHPLIKEIREKSPQMNERLLNADRDIRDATKEFSTSESALATYKKAGFKATVAMQFYVADVVAWQGAYLQALTDGMTEKDAINRADFVVEQAMGAGYTRALSKIQRGGSIQRFLTMFYTFGSVLYNLAARRAGITKKQLASGQYGAAALGASSFLVLQWVMPVLLEALVRGDAADDDDDETLAEKLLVNLLTYPAQSVLIARELSGIAKGFKYRFSPALKPFESVGQWISSVARAIEQEDASIAAKPTAQLVGTTTGLIPAQFINSGEVLTDYLTGEDQELSVKELLYGKRRQ